MDIIDNLMKAALYECCSPQNIENILTSLAYSTAIKYANDDIVSFLKKDPSASNDKILLAQTSTSYAAVLHYRLAHFIFGSDSKSSSDEKLYCAHLISQRGKLKSGAEIHFKAMIGKNFILDHGYGTVIGDTTIIGDDCYILGGVILGAKGISGNPCEPRHPIIGNNVQIGSFSKVFGRISIGDGAFIGSNLTITNDIPSHKKIIYKSQI